MPFTTCPSIAIVPAPGFSSPAMSFSVVVLPQPEAPTSATISPVSTASESLLMTGVAPYDRLTPSRSRLTAAAPFRSSPFPDGSNTPHPAREESATRDRRHAASPVRSAPPPPEPFAPATEGPHDAGTYCPASGRLPAHSRKTSAH